MTIDPASHATTPRSSAMSLDLHRAKADFQALSTALKANDLTGAQKDFAALETDAPSLSTAISGSPNLSGTTPLDSFKALASSLQSNDLAGAKSAMNALQQNLAANEQLRPHHHHHRLYSGGSTPATPSTTAVTPPAPSGSSFAATA